MSSLPKDDREFGRHKLTVPAVTDSIESIELTEAALEAAENVTPSQRRELREGITTLRKQNSDRYGSEQKVLFLDLERGFTLEQPIKNNKTAAESDRTVAFVQGHRYVLHQAYAKIPLRHPSSKTNSKTREHSPRIIS